MEPVLDRAEAAGYRRDWRGVVAYFFTPVVWTTTGFTLHVMFWGGFVGVALSRAAADGPIVMLPVNALFAYWFVLRPILRDAKDRASSATRSPATAASIDV